MGNFCNYLRTGNAFIIVTQNTEIIKEKSDKIKQIKNLNICISKNTVKRKMKSGEK